MFIAFNIVSVILFCFLIFNFGLESLKLNVDDINFLCGIIFKINETSKFEKLEYKIVWFRGGPENNVIPIEIFSKYLRSCISFLISLVFSRSDIELCTRFLMSKGSEIICYVDTNNCF